MHKNFMRQIFLLEHHLPPKIIKFSFSMRSNAKSHLKQIRNEIEIKTLRKVKKNLVWLLRRQLITSTIDSVLFAFAEHQMIFIENDRCEIICHLDLLLPNFLSCFFYLFFLLSPPPSRSPDFITDDVKEKNTHRK